MGAESWQDRIAAMTTARLAFAPGPAYADFVVHT
jgi:hypothetical protein